MKFLCDRCKTRYSIGDDRVRGKILKIRCKNCANVITVREGMSDAADDLGPRRNRTTTMAPSAIAPPVASPPATNGARGPKPPPALEEEWYVSIDGEQEGPYSLVDAQRWVAGKGIDADLHCWSEGFDDWLPVDKVSHFRGLRKKPAAPAMPAPPPLPRAATAAANLRVPEAEKTPKPLFAATMASIEKSAQATPSGMPAGGLDLPAPKPRPSATPPGGEKSMPLGAKTNGSPFTKKSDAARDTDAFGQTDGATQIDSRPFHDDVPAAASVTARPKIVPATTPAPDPSPAPVIPSRAPSPFPRAETKPTLDTAKPLPDDAAYAAVPAAIPGSNGNDDDEDDGLSIGEVSRVVKLADLMASAKPKQAQAQARRAATGAATPLNRTASTPRISQTGLTDRVDDPAAAVAAGIAPEAVADVPHDMAVPPAVHETHRRGLFILIGVAGVLLAGVIVAVLLLLGGHETTDSSLGRQGGIDTTRPDDPLHPQGTGGGSQVAEANPFLPPQPKIPIRPRNPINPNSNPTNDNPLGGDRIGGDEVEAMAAKNSGMTQSCYRRAQRGANSILIGDVKKINVTLEIDPTGMVKTVSLDSNSANDLGKCLLSAIKLWKFRTSPGGTYKFALVFSSN